MLRSDNAKVGMIMKYIVVLIRWEILHILIYVYIILENRKMEVFHFLRCNEVIYISA